MNSTAGQTVVRLKDFRVGDVGHQVSNALNSFAGQLADGVQQWTSKARTAAKSTDGFVRSSPWQAVGAAALAALAAGFLLSRASRRARVAAQTDHRESEVSGG